MASVAPADPTRRLANASSQPSDVFATDVDLFQRSSDSVLSQFQELEKRVLEIDPRLRKIVKFQFSETRTVCALRTTFGVASQTEFSNTGVVAEILAVENGETEVAWDSGAARFGRDLDMKTMSLDLAQHALSSLGAPRPAHRFLFGGACAARRRSDFRFVGRSIVGGRGSNGPLFSGRKKGTPDRFPSPERVWTILFYRQGSPARRSPTKECRGARSRCSTTAR